MTSIAFDLDGTIIDCRERQCMLTVALCRAIPVRLDVDEFWHAKREGATTRQALRKCLEDQTIANSLAELWARQIEQEQWLRLDRILPGVIEVLEIIQTANVQLHLITARRDRQALYRQLSWLGLRSFFASINVVSPQNASSEKGAFLSGIHPLLFVGDTESDYHSAQASRTAFHPVATGQRSWKFISELMGSQACMHKEDLSSTIRKAIDANQFGKRPA